MSIPTEKGPTLLLLLKPGGAPGFIFLGGNGESVPEAEFPNRRDG